LRFNEEKVDTILWEQHIVKPGPKLDSDLPRFKVGIRFRMSAWLKV
jgi:hypothetical protein